MKSNQHEPFDLNKMLRLIHRRKWLIFGCLLGTLLPIIGYNHFSRPSYMASTTIVFEEQTGPAASIDPFRISLNESYIINQIEEIKSHSLSEEVAKALPLSIVKSFQLPKETTPDFNNIEYVAEQIQKRISASSVPNSEIIKIEVEAYSPIAAKVIANTIADILKKRNLDVRREETTNVREIIKEQLETFKGQLDSAEMSLKNFKEQSKVTAIDREAEEIFRRITEAEVVYNQTKTNLDAARKRLSVIQSKLAKERKDLVPTITEITSPWAQMLKQQLVELEVHYTNLKVQNYSDDHPKMLKLKEQIEQTKNNLKQESLKIAAGENIVDPISQIQRYMEESITLEIEIQTYSAQERTLQKVINDYKKNLNTLPNKELRLAQLLREKEVNEKIYTMLLEKREEAKIAEAEKVGNIRIIDPAKINNVPVKPRKIVNLIIAIILGFIIGIGLAFLLEFLDDSVKTMEEAEQITELSVLGTIPKIRSTIQKIEDVEKRNGKKSSEIISKLITIHNPKSPESEAFRSLRTNLQFSGINTPLRTILFTSSEPSEGKSFITANLSITAAQMGLKTLLIDADLRKPVLHTLFQTNKGPGLIDIIFTRENMKHKTNYSIPVSGQENILNDLEIVDIITSRKIGTNETSNLVPVIEPEQISDDGDISDSNQYDRAKTNLARTQQHINSKDSGKYHRAELLESAIKNTISTTNIANLDLLTCGTIPPNPSEILSSKAVKNLFLILKNQYDAIFIDTPPINAVTDAGILSSIVDGSVLVVKAGTSSRKDIKRAKGLLQKAQGKIIGIVLNYLVAQDGYSNYYYYYFKDNTNGKKVKKRKRKNIS